MISKTQWRGTAIKRKAKTVRSTKDIYTTEENNELSKILHISLEYTLYNVMYIHVQHLHRHRQKHLTYDSKIFAVQNKCVSVCVVLTAQLFWSRPSMKQLKVRSAYNQQITNCIKYHQSGTEWIKLSQTCNTTQCRRTWRQWSVLELIIWHRNTQSYSNG